jgi:hypothetical protein
VLGTTTPVLGTEPPVVVADPPAPTCNDIQPGIVQDQPWICDPQNGWYPNQAAANSVNPSNEVCCLVSCHAADAWHVICLALSLFVAGTAQCCDCHDLMACTCCHECMCLQSCFVMIWLRRAAEYEADGRVTSLSWCRFCCAFYNSM